jgi:hypothetical protein
MDNGDDDIDDEEIWRSICEIAARHPAFHPKRPRAFAKMPAFMPMVTRALSRR